MNSNQVGAANSVPPMPYTPASRQAPAEAPEKKAPNALDNLLGQLSTVLTASTKAQDSSTAEALIAHLGAGGGEADLPPELLELLNAVIATAEKAGKADEFKALLREYVAVQWALCQLDELIASQEAGGTGDDYNFEQLAQARAFLQQLEAAVANRLDSQDWYANWRQVYLEEAEANAEGAAFTLPQGVDAVTAVVRLLEAAPRPALAHIN